MNHNEAKIQATGSGESLFNRMGECLKCRINPAKYRCPKCNIVTCSLSCVNSHKESDGCDGIRKKTGYVAMKNFTEMDLNSDFRLLEAANKCVEGYQRDKLKKSTRQGPEAQVLPKHLIIFKNACFRRGRCKLHFLPPQFERHKSNTSSFNWKSKEIKWRIQIDLPHSGTTIFKDGISENTLLYDLVCLFIEPPDHEDFDTPYLPYMAAGWARVKVCLKTERMLRKRRRYFDLDLSKSLKDNFCGKVIVEHPIIVLFLEDHKASFGYEESSSEDDNDTKCGLPKDDSQSATEADKGCYDYYLQYFNEKYGVKDAHDKSKPEESSDRVKDIQSNTSSFPLVSYSGSDSE